MTRLHWRLGISAVFGAMVLVGATGCAEDSADAGTGGGGNAAGGEQMVTITEPAEGASVDVPFTLSLDSSVELGTTESGNHHVHLYFDGDDSKYEVIESESMEITDASPAVDGLRSGEHELNISLRNADHSPAGFETSVMVRFGQEQPQNDTGTGGGY
jgi:hypothetical protein